MHPAGATRRRGGPHAGCGCCTAGCWSPTWHRSWTSGPRPQMTGHSSCSVCSKQKTGSTLMAQPSVNVMQMMCWSFITQQPLDPCVSLTLVEAVAPGMARPAGWACCAHAPWSWWNGVAAGRCRGSCGCCGCGPPHCRRSGAGWLTGPPPPLLPHLLQQHPPRSSAQRGLWQSWARCQSAGAHSWPARCRRHNPHRQALRLHMSARSKSYTGRMRVSALQA